MIDSVINTATSFWSFYVSLAKDYWNHMTPMKYGFLLVFIFVAGFFLLKSNIRRT